MADLQASGLCAACDQPGARLCGRCKSARYCSPACQQKDWPTHKLLCASFASFATSSRRTKEHVRAILFPVDKWKPQVLWLQEPDVEQILGDDSGKYPQIQYKEIFQSELSDTIYVSYRDTFLIDGSKPNKSIAAITATKPGQYYDWRGPIVAYGAKEVGVDPTPCRDLDMNDFRHVTDYFLSYRYEAPLHPQQSNAPKIKGVRIDCIGDKKMFNKPHFEAVEVPGDHPIFSKADTSDIADRIGLPIFTRRCRPGPKWANYQDTAMFDHQIPFENQDDGVGVGAAQKWQKSVGSVIVVRQDKKPLDPLHVEALCKHCQYEIRPLLGHSIGEYSPEEPLSRDAVLAMICRATFVICWYNLMDEKREKGEDPSAPYPYET